MLTRFGKYLYSLLIRQGQRCAVRNPSACIITDILQAPLFNRSTANCLKSAVGVDTSANQAGVGVRLFSRHGTDSAAELRTVCQDHVSIGRLSCSAEDTAHADAQIILLFPGCKRANRFLSGNIAVIEASG